MFRYFILLTSILGQILTVDAQRYSNHVKVSSRLDLSGSLKHLCPGDDQNDDDEVVSCDCLSKLSISSTVQVGKYQNVHQYNESNQNGDSTYASLHQTEKDLNVHGFGRLNFENVKCVENNEVKEVTSKYTHWFHLYSFYHYVNSQNGLFGDAEYDSSLTVSMVDISLDNAPQILYLKLSINKTKIYNFEDNLGTMCGESLEKGSWERTLWTIIDQAMLHNDNNCDYPKGTTFPIVEDIPITVTVDEPLKCGLYEMSFGFAGQYNVVSWNGKVTWYLEAGSTCV